LGGRTRRLRPNRARGIVQSSGETEGLEARCSQACSDTNLYGYALNDPVNFIEPTGKWVGVDELVGAAIGGVVNTRAYVAGQLIKHHGNIGSPKGCVEREVPKGQ